MVYNPNFDKDFEEGKDMIYDLRQQYANIIGGILREINVARMLKKWNVVFELLNDNLYIMIHQKLKPTEEKQYEEKLQLTKEMIFKYQNAFLGKSQDPTEIENIKKAIKDLEMFLLWLMEKHKLFGAKEELELI